MKMFVLLLTLLLSFSALAKNVSCDVKINNRVATGGIKEIPQTEGEAEGAGHLLLVAQDNIKVYVMNYPLQIVANYEVDGVVVEVKKSSMIKTIAFHRDSATLKTSIDGNKIFAKCSEVENID